MLRYFLWIGVGVVYIFDFDYIKYIKVILVDLLF